MFLVCFDFVTFEKQQTADRVKVMLTLLKATLACFNCTTYFSGNSKLFLVYSRWKVDFLINDA